MPSTNQCRLSNLGPLHDLMINACPTNIDSDMKSVAKLAEAINCTPQALYKAIGRGRVSAKLALKIVGVADEGTVTLDDFHAYVYAD